MRSAFLRLVLLGLKPKSIKESMKIIDELNPCDPMIIELEKTIDNREMFELLNKLKNVKINKLRNNVVHKMAYRPSKIETEKTLAEAREILFGLNRIFELYDEPNWYINNISTL